MICHIAAGDPMPV